jgi:hypothetical protein
MHDRNTQKLLTQFFGGYFHQDCFGDAVSSEAVVAAYIADTKTLGDDQFLGLVKAILDYAARFVTDRELEEGLFREPGCYYCPSGTGDSAKQWLASVAKQLLDSRGLALDLGSANSGPRG